LIEAAYDHAAKEGYLGHEYGDSNLILGRSSEMAVAA
jgi:S-adenosylmethionine:tRNA-ribosyltransferase-isomerase (queuine synthetase)